MILKDKVILVMGIRNKWSIAYGAAKSAFDQGAKVIFTFMGEENREKIEELVAEFGETKAYACDASIDSELEDLFSKVKKDFGRIDGVVHCIAHAFTDDLHNPFVETSKEGYSHAVDVSSYTFVATARIAKEKDVLADGASLVSLTYHGSTKVLPNYNVMGVAKAALECSVRYLADNLGPMGIRVNAISAGPIKTLSAKGIKDFGSILDVVEQKAPLRRNVTKEQVGDSVAFLLSEMASAITGQIIYADSGYNIMGI